MIDNKTQRLALPLPNVDNYLEDDVVRLSEALQILDAKVATVGDDGKIPVSQIPAVALTDTFPVNSEAAMLALEAQPGDVAIRNDLSKSFILMATPATMLGNWKEIVNDALVQLASNDGERLIGICPDIATLRLIEPKSAGQRITLREHTAGTGKGGGQFRSVMDGSTYTDNNGTIIKTTAGAVWLRINADITNPLMFGAQCTDGVDDSLALRAASDAAERMDGLGLTYFINDTVYWNQFVGRRYRYNFVLRAMASLPDGRPMVRIGNDQYVDKFVLDAGAQTVGVGTIGLVWEGGRPGFGGAVTNGYIAYTGSQGLYVSGDYTANKYAERGIIDNIRFQTCGNRGTGNGRATLGTDGVSNFSISNIVANGCNWGLYFRNDLNIAGVARKAHNKLHNATLRGSGRTHATMTDAQGISASFQDDLQIYNVDISDFADNAIDMQYCDASIVTNWRATNCKDGVFMGDRGCSRHKISNGIAVSCDRAIRLTTDGSYVMNGTAPQLTNVTIENVDSYNHHFEGFWIRNSGKGAGSSMRNIKLIGCTADGSASYTESTNGHGFNIAGGEDVTLENCYAFNTRKSGFFVEDSEFVSLLRCKATNADREGAGNPALDITCVRATVDICQAYGSSTAVGLRLRAGSNSSAIRGFRWRGVASGMDVQAGSNSVVQTDNLQW